MRSVARTDILQFLVLMGLGISAFMIIAIQAARTGAWQALAADVSVNGPNARSGLDGSQTTLVLAGYCVLWSLANPMFPHFIQRFYAANSDRSLLSSMAAYPFVSLLIFLPMTAIGVLGARLIPGLTGSAADGIFSLLANQVAGPIWGPVFALAALAALMSTLDSQLLSCASIVVEDFLPGKRHSANLVGLVGLALAAVAWLVSLKPPASILGFLTGTAFPGYASLAPIALAAIYLPRFYRTAAATQPAAATGVPATLSPVLAWSCATALLVGTGLVLIQAFGIKPSIPAAIFNAAIQLTILGGFWLAWRLHQVAASRLATRQSSKLALATLPDAALPSRRRLLVAGLSSGLTLVAALDWWHAGQAPIIVWGLPTWLWYQLGVVVLLGIIFVWLARQTPARPK